MYKLKKMLKSILPNFIKSILLSMYDKANRLVLQRYHSRIFNRSYMKDLKAADQQQLESKLSFHAHALEKGLSHEDLRLGFGRTALEKLAETLDMYTRKGFNKSSISYRNTISVLNEYKRVHLESGYSIDYFNQMFDAIIDEIDADKSGLGGVLCITKKPADKQNFKELFESRWSVREYSDRPVDVSRVKDAVKLSMKSPSVCNRQSARVRIITDTEIIKRVLKVQGGFTGYDTPPVLLVVTSDMRTFLASTERNQPYIDGGIFSMSLLMSLEFYGLAACPLNAMFNKKRDILVKAIAGIQDYEALIMFISVGNFKTTSKVPKSFRITAEEVIKQ